MRRASLAVLVVEVTALRAVRDVQDGAGWFQQRVVYPELQHRCAGVTDSSGHNLLFDIYCLETSSTTDEQRMI